MSKVQKTACYLSEDLLIEIMKRLPVEYILRCRCVQKSWSRILRSPYFIALHSSLQHSSNKYLLFHNSLSRERDFSIRFDDNQCKEYRKLRIPEFFQCRSSALVYETCNGLICLSARYMHQVFIWNPSVRVFDVLPDSPLPNDGRSFTDHITLGLAFVYLAKTNDYKVIKYEGLLGTRPSEECSVYVYSLSTDSWKPVKKAKVRGFSKNKLSNSVVVNGAAYWVARTHEIVKNDKVIVCFDMENDTIREIMLPLPYSEKKAESDVLVENTQLLSLFYYDRSTFILHNWVLENAGEPNEVWMKKKSFNFEPIWQPLGFRNNGEIVLSGGARKFLSYDLEKSEAKDIVDDDDSLDAFYWCGRIHPFPHQGLNRFQENLVVLDVNRQAKISPN